MTLGVTFLLLPQGSRSRFALQAVCLVAALAETFCPGSLCLGHEELESKRLQGAY